LHFLTKRVRLWWRGEPTTCCGLEERYVVSTNWRSGLPAGSGLRGRVLHGQSP